MQNVSMALVALLTWVTLCGPAQAVQTPWTEGSLHGFPTMMDAQGKAIGNGDLSQKILPDGILQTDSVYTMSDGTVIHEVSTYRQKPELAQLTWDWSQKSGDQVLRHFVVDFTKKHATAMKLERDGKAKNWDEDLGDIKLGQTFAGGGFVLAIKALHGRLLKGEHIELTAVAMTTKPRTGKVEIYRKDEQTIQVAGRDFKTDRIVIHPKMNPLFRLIVHPKDNLFWFVPGTPPAFLRFEGPLVELHDDVVRIDLMASAPAVISPPPKHP